MSSRVRIPIKPGARQVVAALCVGSFLLRLGVILYLRTYEQSWQTDLGVIASGIAEGRGYTYRGLTSAYFGPVYVYLWGLTQALMGAAAGTLIIQVLQAAALSTMPWSLYSIATRTFGRTVGMIAGLWFVCYPTYLVLSSQMQVENFIVPLLMAVVALGMSLQINPSGRLAVITGILAGIMILTKGRMAFLCAVVVLVIAWPSLWEQISRLRAHSSSFSASNGRLLSLVLAMMAVTIAVILPWTLRNWYVFEGRLVPVETAFGMNLWYGHNENATGTGKMNLDGVQFTKPVDLQAELLTIKSEPEKDAIYLRYALAFIVGHPREELLLAAKKSLYAWWFDPTSAEANHALYRWPWMLTLPFFATGLCSARRMWTRSPLVLLLGLLVASTLIQVAFFVVPRFRMPAEPVVFLFAAQGSVELTQKALGSIIRAVTGKGRSMGDPSVVSPTRAEM